MYPPSFLAATANVDKNVVDLEDLQYYVTTHQFPSTFKNNKSAKSRLKRKLDTYLWNDDEKRFYTYVKPLSGSGDVSHLVPVAKDGEEIRKVLYACHYSAGGHGTHDGVRRMWTDVRTRLFFNDSYNTCSQVCSSCVSCCQVKGELVGTSAPVTAILTRKTNHRVRACN